MYVELIRENDRNSMVSDDLSMTIEEFPDDIDLPPSKL